MTKVQKRWSSTSLTPMSYSWEVINPPDSWISHCYVDSPVKGPQEAALDSALLLKASSMGAQKARAMKSGSGNFDIDEFVSKLITYMGGRRTLEDQDPEDSDVEQDGDAPLDWERIGRRALAKSHRAPAPTFM